MSITNSNNNNTQKKHRALDNLNNSSFQVIDNPVCNIQTNRVFLISLCRCTIIDTGIVINKVENTEKVSASL